MIAWLPSEPRRQYESPFLSFAHSAPRAPLPGSDMSHRCAFAKIVSIALALALSCANGARAQGDLGDAISSRRYIAIDATTGEVFAEKDAHDQVAIASITKVFTLIEAIERAPLSMEITTVEADVFDERSSTMGFGPGETFTLEELLYGMMLPSGNDAAHAIARAIAAEPGDTPEESVNRFVGYMNERVRAMGLTETNFVNPHGWGVPGHYSSAHDVAVFTMYALQYPTFVEIIGTRQYEVGDYTLVNNNRLLQNGFPGLIGGKTGFDFDSGWCLMVAAQRSSGTMMSVTLDGVAPDIWYQDNEVLLDYAFERKSERLAAGEPIAGDVVSFVDPDAAVVASMVTPGATLGQAAQAATTPLPNVPTPASTATSVGTAEGIDSGGRSRVAIAWIVAGIVVLVAIGFRLLGAEPKQSSHCRASARTSGRSGSGAGGENPVDE